MQPCKFGLIYSLKYTVKFLNLRDQTCIVV